MPMTTFKISLDQELLDWLRAEAGRQHCSIAQVIRSLIVKQTTAAKRRARLHEGKCPTCGKEPMGPRCPLKCDENH